MEMDFEPHFSLFDQNFWLKLDFFFLHHDNCSWLLNLGQYLDKKERGQEF